MSPTLKLLKVTRPVQFIAAALGTWVIAIVCNGPNPFSKNKIAAAIAMGINCLAASVFHYGAADYMYRRKAEAAPINNPKLLVLWGLLGFALSVAIASAYLPSPVLWVVLANIVILVLYPKILSRNWWTKNLPIAYVCITPILAGWGAGTHTNPVIPFVAPAIFFIYGARELIKDIEDRTTNHLAGRVTMPIRFGVPAAMRTSSCLIVIGTMFLFLLMRRLTLPITSVRLIQVSLTIFALTALQLLIARDIGKTHRQITLGVYSLISAVMLLGVAH